MTEATHLTQVGQRFRHNAPKVAMQVIDGEAILIHFERGFYFSARGTGCALLRQLDQGLTVSEIVETYSQRGSDRALAQALISGYVERLLAEDLLVAREDGSASSAATALGVQLDLGEPELVKYTDLEDLLKLDPIHDVDEMGWPPREGVASAAPRG